MRRLYLVIFGFILIFLVTMGLDPKAAAWVSGRTYISVENIEGSAANNGLFLSLALGTTDPAQAEKVKSIRAWNTDPNIDPTIYTDWFEFISVRNTYTYYQFTILAEYTDHHYGAYNIEVTYQDDTTETVTTPAINLWTDPFASPTGLEVDFSSDTTTPTFRFMPVDDPNNEIDNYKVRLRCWEGPHQARMIYRTIAIPPDGPFEVTYPDPAKSDGGGTVEDLEPETEYEVRVDACNEEGDVVYRSQYRLYFSLDQDDDGILDLVDTAPNNPSNVDFADAATTSGEIESRGNQRLIITYEPDPKGVRIIASIFGDGPTPARVSACGGAANYSLDAGDQMIVTCSSVKTEILYGTVEIEFRADDGTPATTNLGEGNVLKFEPDTLTFTAALDNPDVIVVLVEGLEYSIAPGESERRIVDIKPGKYPNSINLKSWGVVPVAVLTAEDLDATTVNPDTVKFAGAVPISSTLKDVDGDGDIDILFHFNTQDLKKLDEESTEATLTGKTYGRQKIEGTDTVKIVH